MLSREICRWTRSNGTWALAEYIEGVEIDAGSRDSLASEPFLSVHDVYKDKGN